MMKDQDKKNEQLISEILNLRKRIAELENTEIEREQLLQEIRENQEQIEATLNALPDLLFEVDRQGRFCEFHSASQELLYASPEEFMDKTVSEILPKEPAAIVMSAIERAAEKGRDFGAIYSLEIGMSVKWFELSITAKRSPKGLYSRFIILVRDITRRKQVEMEKEKLILELKEAMSKIKILRGLLPICSSCNKIRNDKGYWDQLEAYISSHSEAKLSHSICPECAKKLYPEFYKDE
jgi:PAS domain S-box-containing protein